MLCIVEEAGRLWVARCSEHERGWVPRRLLESWLCLMRQVELLRVPLAFGRAHPAVTLSENAGVATKCWATSMVSDNSARVEQAPAPALPTEEELAAATAWQVAHADA